MAPSNHVAAVALAAIVLLAGCSAGVDGPTTAGGTDQPGDAVSPAAETGTLSFYVSDRPNAIGDFENLTVTVTEIGVHRAAAGGDGDDEEGGDTPPSPEENATEGENTTTTNETTTTTTNGTTSAATTTAEESSSGDAENGSDSGWVTHAVDNETVDLTELQGDNATKIADVSLPAADYNGVYLEVANVSGTLTTGETVGAKLPSGRLRLHKGFALGANATTTFVFDIAVHQTGDGRYILRPVVGQSGPDVPIQAVGSARDGDSPREGVQPQQGARAGDGPTQGNNGSASGNSGPQSDARGGGPEGRQGGNASASGSQPGNGTAA